MLAKHAGPNAKRIIRERTCKLHTEDITSCMTSCMTTLPKILRRSFIDKYLLKTFCSIHWHVYDHVSSCTLELFLECEVSSWRFYRTLKLHPHSEMSHSRTTRRSPEIIHTCSLSTLTLTCLLIRLYWDVFITGLQWNILLKHYL